MKNVLASVIVPAYNAEKTIGRCIDSLLNQTFENIEIIIVDDGSTDGTELICSSFCDERIRFVHQENGGVSSARNRGLEIAEGEYILFCDSDDWVEENFVECLCNEFDNSDIDLVVCGLYLNDIPNKKICTKNSDSEKIKIIDASGFTELREKDLLAYPVNKAFRKKEIDKNALCFDVNLHECEDLVFNLNYISKMNGSIAVVPDVLYHYEFSGDSLSTKYHNDRFFDVIRPIFSAYENTLCELDIKQVDFLKDIYTTYFLKIIENIPMLWDERNTFGFFRKLKKVRSIVLSREYSKCFEKMDKGRFDKKFLLTFGSKNWILVLLFMKVFMWKK